MKCTQDHNHRGSDDEPLKHKNFEILKFFKLANFLQQQKTKPVLKANRDFQMEV